MKFNLIPFGFHEVSQKLVDIADVPRGKKCGCICPSCKTPLIARHGNIKEWHFAHLSRNIYDKTEQKCEYSFFVSVRMMARQIIGEELGITLPSYEESVSDYIEDYGEICVPFVVAKSQDITLSGIQLEQSVLGAVVDVLGNVDTFKFIIYFTHPGREVPETLINPSDSNFGIIAISLSTLEMLFLQAKDSKKTYHKILYDYLVSNLDSKEWLFHPRFERCKANALNQLEQEVRLKNQEIYESERIEREVQKQHSVNGIEKERKRANTIESQPPQRMANYKCVLCHSEWQGLEPGGSECPSCKNILCRTVTSYVD